MASANDDPIESLVQRPSESLPIEIKNWIDIRDTEGIAKLIKSIFAISNRNGGYLVIGFNNVSGLPDAYSFDTPACELFHQDKVQSLVMKYASQPLAIEVHWRTRGNQEHPVIAVGSGVQVPTIVKSDLLAEGGKRLLCGGDLYFRTLRANHTPSSAKILPADFGELMEICFNNRESDIGGFLRRQLGQTELATLAKLLADLADSGSFQSNPSLKARAEHARDAGRAALTKAAVERADEIPASAMQGLAFEVGLVFDPEKPSEVPKRSFLEQLSTANLNYTGWPVWLDSRSFHEEKDLPVVRGPFWEALIVDLGGGWSQHFDFMRLSPTGQFYLFRLMQDDLTDKVKPKTALDVFLMLIRVAEVLAVGLSFAQTLNWADGSTAGYNFRWSSLSGRRLSFWANPMRYLGLGGGGIAADDVANSFVEVPISTPHAALAPYVSKAVEPLFSLFGGYEPSQALVEDAVKRLVERKL